MERPDFMMRLAGCTLKDRGNLLSLLWGRKVAQAEGHMAERRTFIQMTGNHQSSVVE